MRKLIVCNIISLDGYYEGQGRNAMLLPLDQAFDACNAEGLRTADTRLLGRRSYEGFKGFWPSVADDPYPTLDAHPPRDSTARQRHRQGRRIGQPDHRTDTTVA